MVIPLYFLYRFNELARDNSVLALKYLQTKLHSAVDHSDCQEVQEFQALASTIFQPPQDPPISYIRPIPEEGEDEGGAKTGSANLEWRHTSRSHLFDQLTQFFPEHMTQPRGNLIDLLPY